MTRSRNVNSTIAAVRAEADGYLRKLVILNSALTILVESHTRDDELMGFVVESGTHRSPWISEGEYIAAWKIVREHLGRPVQTRFEREQAEAYQATLSKSPAIR